MLDAQQSETGAEHSEGGTMRFAALLFFIFLLSILPLVNAAVKWEEYGRRIQAVFLARDHRQCRTWRKSTCSNGFGAGFWRFGPPSVTCQARREYGSAPQRSLGRARRPRVPPQPSSPMIPETSGSRRRRLVPRSNQKRRAWRVYRPSHRLEHAQWPSATARPLQIPLSQ